MSEKQLLEPIPGPDRCPKHGIIYGSCASCRKEQKQRMEQGRIDRIKSQRDEMKKQRGALLDACRWLLDEVDTIHYPIKSKKLIYKAKLRTAITQMEKEG